MYFSFKKKSTKRNLPFCTACTTAYVIFFDVASSRPFLAMHPEVSGCIDAPTDGVDWMLHSWGVRDKKAGVQGEGSRL